MKWISFHPTVVYLIPMFFMLTMWKSMHTLLVDKWKFRFHILWNLSRKVNKPKICTNFIFIHFSKLIFGASYFSDMVLESEKKMKKKKTSSCICMQFINAHNSFPLLPCNLTCILTWFQNKLPVTDSKEEKHISIKWQMHTHTHKQNFIKFCWGFWFDQIKSNWLQ